MKALSCLNVMLAIFLWPWFSPASALTVLTEEEAARTMAITYRMDDRYTVSGTVVNKSPHLIRDPEVLIEYHWLWADEFNPGDNPPGKAAYVKVAKEIQPGRSASFTYTPPSLPDRRDGSFLTEVSPAAFAVVVSPQRSSSR